MTERDRLGNEGDAPGGAPGEDGRKEREMRGIWRVMGLPLAVGVAASVRRYLILTTVLTTLLVGLIPAPASAEEGVRFREAVTSTRGVVASISDLASAVGIDVLDRGGNAIDAAVATVFAVGVVRPDFGGIGGAGFLVYRGANNRTEALDFRETSSASMTATDLKGPG
ncbi:MAG TPA: gamma-glutamyltransferase, partial [Actinomycetota bacterium]|nr:gamma-glutamyltransferase [Actinomycetota bacterium]